MTNQIITNVFCYISAAAENNGASCEYGDYLPGVFCGRGPTRQDCPQDYFCNIDPTDRFAVCCPGMIRGSIN